MDSNIYISGGDTPFRGDVENLKTGTYAEGASSEPISLFVNMICSMERTIDNLGKGLVLPYNLPISYYKVWQHH